MIAAEHARRFLFEDGRVRVGGLGLERLAARVGSTPFFAYDRGLLTARVAEVRAALPDDLDLGYAVKANPMPALVQHLAGLVDTLDVASAGEMAVALDTGTPAERITFAGPGKTDDELRRAVAAGVLVEVESEGEARRLGTVARALGLAARAAIRVNPDFAVKGSGMRMGGGPQQFGVDAEAVPALMDRLAGIGMELEGFHVFAGSQNLHAPILAEAQERTVDLVLQLAKYAAGPVRYVNLGGGFGIPYFEKDHPLDLDAVGANLRRLCAERLRPVLGEARIGVELGRYLVGEAGVYVTRVVDRKVSRGVTYLVVDGGMHHQLAASGNFGQVIRRNYPITADVAGAADPEGEREEVTVVGSLCTPLDVLGDKVRLPSADVGDLLVVHQAGAYGLTASPTAFLGHPAPAEVLV
ncbi:pyridoxal-dependent decarboxylase, exosortase A system-associated [Nocardioides sp. STR2]|uniref:Pyridoxal-dependent decarboxylase, exosortase A system-associated n=1 Tax=Nocardioides pini TaxID=2975053 RepID=A0ABT4CGF1_9ACTN|nr:pyridoxal-dependent decarboxylase, exosortase A system-associated [Nocardioides pini]MCY4726972.1 pyridoxal-dependent decarboxylase, exosortase A system-associated [Nocardioides pini]